MKTCEFAMLAGKQGELLAPGVFIAFCLLPEETLLT